MIYALRTINKPLTIDPGIANIVIIGGLSEFRYSYLNRMINSIEQSDNHLLYVFDLNNSVFQTSSQGYSDSLYKTYFPHDFAAKSSFLLEEIKKRDEIIQKNKELKGAKKPTFPKITIVINDFDYLKPLSNSEWQIKKLLEYCLNDSNHLMNDLDVNIIIALSDLKGVERKNDLLKIFLRVYLGGCDENTEEFLFGEPCYLKPNSGKLIASIYKSKTTTLYVPFRRKYEPWVIDALKVFQNDDCPTYLKNALFLCLNCFKEYLSFDTNWCPNCLDETYYSIALGVLFLKAIHEGLLLKKKGKGLESFVLSTVAKVGCFETIDNLSTFIDQLRKDKFVYKQGLYSVYEYYFEEYSRLVQNRKNKKIIFIKEATFNGLFGNESFKINFESEENISVLYATNAFGKTTIFRTITGLLSNSSEKENIDNFLYIQSIPFSSIQIEFNNGSSFLVTKNNNNSNQLWLNYFGKDSNNDDRVVIGCDRHYMANDIKRHFNLLQKNIGFNNAVQLISANRLFDIDGMLRHFSEQLSNKVVPVVFNDTSKITINDVSYGSLKKIYNNFIGDSSIENLENEIKHLNGNLYFLLLDKGIINNKIGDNIEVFVSPQSLKKWNSLFKDNFINKFEGDFQNRFDAFVGIDEKDVSENKKAFYNKVNSCIDALYDLRLKFKQFKKLFESFYDSYNPSLKTIDVKNEKVIIRSSTQKELNINQLSTGERQFMSVLYSLIFELTDNSILLIDEPEISLHVTWQIKLMKAITELVSERNNLQVIIATHSPFIGTNHNDSLAEVEIIDGD